MFFSEGVGSLIVGEGGVEEYFDGADAWMQILFLLRLRIVIDEAIFCLIQVPLVVAGQFQFNYLHNYSSTNS